MEDYRMKQQQCAMAPPAVLPGVQPQLTLVPAAAQPVLGQPGFPLVAQPLPHTTVAPGHASPVRMPSLPGWQPPGGPAHLSLNPPRIQPPVAQLPMKACTPAPGTVSGANPQSGPPPRVEFDDNNPFSESFQERERKERLREQQERQRIQLLQEVDRQRALQQRMELSARPAAPQAPFYGPDLPCDFLQPPRPLQPSPQHQQQAGQALQQQGAHRSVGSPPTPTFMAAGERRQLGPPPFVPDSPSMPGGSPNFHPGQQAPGGLPGASFPQSPVRPPFTPALSAAPPGASSGLPCGQDLAVAHGQGYPGSAQSLIQLYSDIIPEEKGKKKRTRKKKKDDDAESTKAPSTPHSDITAPPTPSVSEATSTPTVHTPSEPPLQGESEPGEAGGPSAPSAAAGQQHAHPESSLPPSEFSQGAPHHQTCATAEVDKRPLDTPAPSEEGKQETAEPEQCPGHEGPPPEARAGSQAADTPAAGAASSGQSPPLAAGAPAAKADSGNELLKHLLKNKKAAALVNQKPEGALCSGDHCAKDSAPVERPGPAEGQVGAARASPACFRVWEAPVAAGRGRGAQPACRLQHGFAAFTLCSAAVILSFLFPWTQCSDSYSCTLLDDTLFLSFKARTQGCFSYVTWACRLVCWFTGLPRRVDAAQAKM